MKIKSTILFLFLSSLTFAQISFEKRIEIEKESFNTSFEVHEFGVTGLIVSSKIASHLDNMIAFEYELYNTALEKTKRSSILFEKKYFPTGIIGQPSAPKHFKTKKGFHTIYKNRKGEYAIINVDASTLEVSKIEGTFGKHSRMKEMVVLNDHAYIHLLKKNKDHLVTVNLNTGIQSNIPFFERNTSQGKTEIQELQVLENENEVFVYLKTKQSQNINEVKVLRLKESGTNQTYFNLSEKGINSIINVSASKISEDDYLFTGTYSSDLELGDDLSEGIFYAHISHDELRFIKRYNYLDLPNFINYLSTENQKNVKVLQKKEAEKGEKLKLYYSLLNHEAQLLPDGILFVGELYYPIMNKKSNSSTSVASSTPSFENVSSFAKSYKEFAGNQYTHSIISKFDKSGNLLWNRIVRTNFTYKPKFEERFIALKKQDDNSINVVLSKENHLAYNSINTNTGLLLQNRSGEKIKPLFEGDQVERSISKAVHWHENYYIVYGMQAIKNKKDKSVKRNRNAFFINLIEYYRPENIN